MTPAEIKKTRLYRTLAPCVRKEDREELARMLAMVDWDSTKWVNWCGHNGEVLRASFDWFESPQGYDYWSELSDSLRFAGHVCY